MLSCTCRIRVSLSPSIVVWSCPAPRSFKSSVISRSPLVATSSVASPPFVSLNSPAPRMISSAPAVLLVASTASRSDIFSSGPGFALSAAIDVVSPSTRSASVVTLIVEDVSGKSLSTSSSNRVLALWAASSSSSIAVGVTCGRVSVASADSSPSGEGSSGISSPKIPATSPEKSVRGSRSSIWQLLPGSLFFFVPNLRKNFLNKSRQARSVC